VSFSRYVADICLKVNSLLIALLEFVTLVKVRIVFSLYLCNCNVAVVAIFTNGSNLHAAIHQFLSGKPEEELVLLPANHGHWQSIQSVLADVTDVACLEKFIRHSHLQYCGVVDCVAEYRFDCLYLICHSCYCL